MHLVTNATVSITTMTAFYDVFLYAKNKCIKILRHISIPIEKILIFSLNDFEFLIDIFGVSLRRHWLLTCTNIYISHKNTQYSTEKK